MMKKISLATPEPSARGKRETQPDTVLEFFFDSGIVFHDLGTVELGANVSRFMVTEDVSQPRPSGTPPNFQVRRAAPGEEAQVELSALDHLAEFSQRWLPMPYQLSAPLAVQMYIAPIRGRSAKVLLAIDTSLKAATQGQAPAEWKGSGLDQNLDADRPYRPLDAGEVGGFLSVPDVRELAARLERQGIDKALFKLAALIECVGPSLPRICMKNVDTLPAVFVSLILDFGNSRSTALLVEQGPDGMAAVPLALRRFSNPFETLEETFESRVTFMPSPFDKKFGFVATGDGFTWPSLVRLGAEAVDRALETPHRFACSLSGPKRYLWDAAQADQRWHFAMKDAGDYPAIAGRLLKYIAEDPRAQPSTSACSAAWPCVQTALRRRPIRAIQTAP
jgi:Virulence factor SrfB